MGNPKKHLCTTCGHEWTHGLNGDHSCTDRLVNIQNSTIKILGNLVEALEDREDDNVDVLLNARLMILHWKSYSDPQLRAALMGSGTLTNSDKEG